MRLLLLPAAALAFLAGGSAAATANATFPSPPRPWNLAFSGSGGMIWFHAGVADALVKGGVISNYTQFAGISGGAVMSTLLAAGVDPGVVVGNVMGTVDLLVGDGVAAAEHPVEAAVAAVTALAAVAVARVTGGSPGGALLRNILENNLPADAADRANTGGTYGGPRAHLFASQLDPAAADILPPSPVGVDLSYMPGGYASRSELIEATVASAFVPCAVGATVWKELRGQAFIDGGAATTVDALCDAVANGGGGGGGGGSWFPPLFPPACARIQALTLGPLATGVSSTAACPTTTNDAPKVAAFPAYNGTGSAAPQGCPAYQAATGRSAVDDFHTVAVTLPSPLDAAICPGCRVATPYSACDLKAFAAFNYGPDTRKWGSVIDDLYRLGQAEGAAWAATNGFGKKT